MNSEKEIKVIKADGQREIFTSKKLVYSLKKAGASDEAALKIAEHITSEIKDDMSTHDIFKHAFNLLHKEERQAALRYSLRRSLMLLGPSGFPFEKFIGELFRLKGYTVLNDQVVAGHCVDHEIDVVAYNEKELIMVEVKFHNQLGLKSDLKVALYVKARFDDLKQATFNYGGEKRTLTEGWLITNTKFTTSAIKYAECQNLKLVGWNYPTSQSLVSIIEESGLHPITSLTSLKTSEKQYLMNKGVVLCNNVSENKEILRELGLKEEDINAIVDEAAMLCPVDPLQSAHLKELTH